MSTDQSFRQMESMTADMSINLDEFEVINTGDHLESTPSTDAASLNNSLLFHPNLVSTTTLVEESMRNGERSLGREETLQHVSMPPSHASDEIIDGMVRTGSDSNSRMEKEIELVRAKLDEMAKNNERLGEELATANAQLSLERRDRQVSSLMQTRVRELETDKEILEKELADARSFLSIEKEGRLTALKTSTADQTRLDELMATKERLEKELAEALSNLSIEKEARQTEVKASTAGQSRMNELMTRSERLERELSDVHSHLSIEKEARLAIHQESVRLQSIVAQLSTKNGGLEKELDETARRFQSIQFQANEGTQNEIRKKNDEITALILRVASLEQANRESENSKAMEVERARATSTGMTDQLRLENAAAQKKIAELSRQLSDAAALTMEHQRTIQELLDENEQRAKIRQLEMELAECKAESENKEAIIGVLKEENDEGSRMLEERRTKMENMKRMLERYGHFIE
ncbi:hypothetical protein PMAYCL1PPCAC_13087 [Pristionchus mayeri]|uniref:Uncharacterized protein n=1 Tax=Pristionchus mayeri TaxID=1317129 RepID=A0AAN4ZKB8_9BILA|nr:hypothetical protein PMAYCL1PPCAC_13087 [Pristionchus mayeri]